MCHEIAWWQLVNHQNVSEWAVAALKLELLQPQKSVSIQRQPGQSWMYAQVRD